MENDQLSGWRRLCVVVWDWVYNGPGALSFKYFLFFYVAYTTYVFIYRLAYVEMYAVVGGFNLFDPDPDHTAANLGGAVTIWAVLGFLRLWWLASWLLAYLRSWYWVRHFPLPSSRYVMQTDQTFMNGYQLDGSLSTVRRPRGCTFRDNPEACDCDAPDQPIADRWYHSGSLLDLQRQGKRSYEYHRLLYDHYCTWINVLVDASTMKPYLIAILGMTLDTIVVTILSIFAMAHPAHKNAILHVPAGIVVFLIVSYLAGHQAWKKWYLLAVRNSVPQELFADDTYRSPRFAISLGGSPPQFIFLTYEGNPWDLGLLANLREVFGLWSAPLFWVQPERVRRYGKIDYPVRAGRCDLRMSDHFWQRVREKVDEHNRSIGSSRVGNAVTTQADRRRRTGNSSSADTTGRNGQRQERSNASGSHS